MCNVSHTDCHVSVCVSFADSLFTSLLISESVSRDDHCDASIHPISHRPSSIIHHPATHCSSHPDKRNTSFQSVVDHNMHTIPHILKVFHTPLTCNERCVMIVWKGAMFYFRIYRFPLSSMWPVVVRMRTLKYHHSLYTSSLSLTHTFYLFNWVDIGHISSHMWLKECATFILFNDTTHSHHHMNDLLIFVLQTIAQLFCNIKRMELRLSLCHSLTLCLILTLPFVLCTPHLLCMHTQATSDWLVHFCSLHLSLSLHTNTNWMHSLTQFVTSQSETDREMHCTALHCTVGVSDRHRQTDRQVAQGGGLVDGWMNEWML